MIKNETKHAWLDDKAFYETCQSYRHAGIVHQDVVVERFEQLKDFIREQSDEELDRLRQQNAELVRALTFFRDDLNSELDYETRVIVNSILATVQS